MIDLRIPAETIPLKHLTSKKVAAWHDVTLVIAEISVRYHLPGELKVVFQCARLHTKYFYYKKE